MNNDNTQSAQGHAYRRSNPWIEAMRLRTLPVSVAGVVVTAGCAAQYHSFKPAPFILCLLFALMAQIVSNFANEYFDFRNGLDRKGREGFRRGVTEGDISPVAMRNATFGLLAVTLLIGLSLLYWGGWWLIIPGFLIAIFALAYSTGPYPLSHNGLGELTVVIFFGLVPVILGTYVQTVSTTPLILTIPVGFAIGLLGANVLIVNNYRDYNDDKSVGKKTLAVKFGREQMPTLYFVNGLLGGIVLIACTLYRLPLIWQVGTLIYINLHYLNWRKMLVMEGAQLNQLLASTARLMCILSLYITTALIINS